MYEIHGWGGDFKGVVTVEVNAPPIDVFTTKRDSLSFNSSARADLNDILQRLSTDPRKALTAVRDKKEILFSSLSRLIQNIALCFATNLANRRLCMGTRKKIGRLL